MIVPNTPYWIRGCRTVGRCVFQDDQNPEFYGVYERQADTTFLSLADFFTREEAEKYVRLLTLSSPINGTEFNEIAHR